MSEDMKKPNISVSVQFITKASIEEISKGSENKINSLPIESNLSISVLFSGEEKGLFFII